MLAYLPIGTFCLNKWRKRIYTSSRERRGLYLLVSVIMAAVPFIYVSSIQVERTALGVVLVGIGLFWFAIVGSRSSIT